ncbi:MAG TPA: hypothetical protein VGU20_01355 [Stellaceae bacterium]|nr:hypothetical protein [Stellaceae bacterium]
MYEQVLDALRRQARLLHELASTKADKDRIIREYAECVLRNRAKLILTRMSQTSDPQKRRRIGRTHAGGGRYSPMRAVA